MIIYHVFTHNTDEFCSTFEEANIIFNQFVADYGCARLYEEERDEDSEVIEENCIKSHGEYPM